VVFDGGGLKEIVVDGDSGFLWSTIAELDEVTRKLIMKMNSDDKDEIDRMRQRAEERASYFSEGRFNESFKKIVG
jgi:glycosyltransferase involved in cell wall biosynthesis